MLIQKQWITILNKNVISNSVKSAMTKFETTGGKKSVFQRFIFSVTLPNILNGIEFFLPELRSIAFKETCSWD